MVIDAPSVTAAFWQAVVPSFEYKSLHTVAPAETVEIELEPTITIAPVNWREKQGKNQKFILYLKTKFCDAKIS